MKDQVYSNWRIDKNISWYNLSTWPLGIVFGLISLEWLREPKIFKRRLKPRKIWMPPVWVTQFSDERERK